MAKVPPGLIKRLPGVGWRDEELGKRKVQVAELRESVRKGKDAFAEQQRELAQTRQELHQLQHQLGRGPERTAGSKAVDAEFARGLRSIEERASFARSLSELRRTAVVLRGVDKRLRHPLRHLPLKLHNYRLAQSHGIPVPEVYQTWLGRDDIDLADLPDRFVIKSDGGAGGHGVLPLVRTGRDQFDLADGTATFDTAAVRAHLARKSLMPPYFAEEFLHQPSGGAIPDDIKFYAFYGDVQMALLRRVPIHGDLKSMGRRYLARDGSDLGAAMPGSTPDSDIEVPRDYAAMVKYAAHLSRATGTTYARVDFYQTDAGPVLGEITRAPGGAQTHSLEVDQAMGEAWDGARFRLDLDLDSGRPFGRLYGAEPAPNPYPEGHWSQDRNENAWTPRIEPCDMWCGAPQPT